MPVASQLNVNHFYWGGFSHLNSWASPGSSAKLFEGKRPHKTGKCANFDFSLVAELIWCPKAPPAIYRAYLSGECFTYKCICWIYVDGLFLIFLQSCRMLWNWCLVYLGYVSRIRRAHRASRQISWQLNCNCFFFSEISNGSKRQVFVPPTPPLATLLGTQLALKGQTCFIYVRSVFSWQWN